MNPKGVLWRMLPRAAQAWLTAYLVDRFDRRALLRFQETHRTFLRVERIWSGGVAVIVPCYNHAEYLEATFTSLAQQTYRPFEAVFVDDHSTDDTLPRLRRFCQSCPKGIYPTLIQVPRNSGQANAINQGIDASQASVIMVHNDDDYLMPDALEATLEILRLNADVFLFGTTALPFSGDGGPPSPGDSVPFIRSSHPDYAAIPLTRYMPADVGGFVSPNDLNMTHSGSTFFKVVWEVAGGYYPNKSMRVVSYSDRDFQLRVASLFPVAVSTVVPFVYWRTDSSVDRGRNS